MYTIVSCKQVAIIEAGAVFRSVTILPASLSHCFVAVDDLSAPTPDLLAVSHPLHMEGRMHDAVTCSRILLEESQNKHSYPVRRVKHSRTTVPYVSTTAHKANLMHFRWAGKAVEAGQGSRAEGNICPGNHA